MTWDAVARKDFNDAVRSYWLWGLSVVFVGVLATPPALIFFDVIQVSAPDGGGGGGLSTDAYVFLMRDTMTLLVPIIAIVVAYASIVGERESGTLKLLLALPHSRRDVVVGKAVGRGGVVVLPVVLGFAAAAIVFFAVPVTFRARSYFLFVALTTLLAGVFVAIAVGVSAGATTNRRAVIGTVGLYVAFTLFWNQFSDGVKQLLTDHAGVGFDTVVPIHLFVKVLNPTQAYKTLVVRLFTDDPVGARLNLVGGANFLQRSINQQTYAEALGDSLPVYLSDPAIVVILLLWTVGAPALGYYAFNEADL